MSHKVRRDSKSQCGSKFTTRSKFTMHSVFSTAGSLGWLGFSINFLWSLFPKQNCAAANGGVTNGGLRGAWPPFPEIGRNRPFSLFFCLFRPFPEGLKSTWEIQKTEEKGLFPQISSDFLNPHLLNPHLRHPKINFLWSLFPKQKQETPRKIRSNSLSKIRVENSEI